MKKGILFIGLLGGLFAANAQTASTYTNAGPATGNVTLNVNLYPLQSITVNPSSSVVNLDYKTSADYLGGVNKTEANHLTVFSTGAFDVKVKSNAASLTGPTGTTAIPLKDIQILATQGSTNPLTGFTPLTAVTLTQNDQIIGGSDTFGSGNINVNYKAAGNNEYLSRVVKGTTPTTYTASLTYSIIAK
ncbi:hypothetical protein FIC_02199 [Flavobacteriaceae bacterium 3519-10]|nr:hypothetical protein FIC_02199 [Flavobacteriaceae bacterium 3519-10]